MPVLYFVCAAINAGIIGSALIEHGEVPALISLCAFYTVAVIAAVLAR